MDTKILVFHIWLEQTEENSHKTNKAIIDLVFNQNVKTY